MAWKHRYSVLAVLFCAYLVCYLDRMVMASAIPFIAADLQLSPLVAGQVLSAFFAGYALMQIPGGLLADRFGARTVLTGSIAWWSVMTALTGFAPGLATLLMARVLFGFGEGPFPSAASKALSIWFPPRELGRANGLQLASTALGATLAPLFVSALVVSMSWRSVFYLLCAPGFILVFLVWRYVTNSPAHSRHVSLQEMADYGVAADPQTSARFSLRQLFSAPAVMWCAACIFFVNMVSWGLMNWLPTYLLQARGFSIEKMGLFAALTNFAAALGYPLGGYLCDRYFMNKLNLPIMIGLIASAALTYLAAGAAAGEWAVFYLVLVFLLSGIIGTAIVTLPLVIVPGHSVGGAFGVVNTAGQLAGVLSPLLVGYILNATQGNFEVVFHCLVALCVIAVYPASRIRQTPDVQRRPSQASAY